ncbi:hypothetical protein Msi02_33200 [Microbispora siamensis]|uniref:Uncharacterized protein n=1 Tax=Microbispora siamensis TaxID=564413 RepID=A0ABQ4GM50_9ACTN|nr:hypothetical protein Msi02_33200 [Microbispora siamensis]
MDLVAPAEGPPAHRAAHTEGVLDAETAGVPVAGHLCRSQAGRVADPPPDASLHLPPDLPSDAAADAEPVTERRPLSKRHPVPQRDSVSQCGPVSQRRPFT